MTTTDPNSLKIDIAFPIIFPLSYFRFVLRIKFLLPVTLALSLFSVMMSMCRGPFAPGIYTLALSDVIGVFIWSLGPLTVTK